MVLKNNLLLILTFLFFPIALVQAQNVEIDYPESVLEDEEFKVVYSIYSKLPFADVPELETTKGLVQLSKPTMQLAEPSFLTRGYYHLLVNVVFKASKEGKYKIPSIKVRIGRAIIKSDARFIKVLALPDFDEIDVFAEVEPTKQSIGVGDKVEVKYKLYSTEKVSDILSINLPEMRNFNIYDVTPKRIVPEEEHLKGKDYYVYTFRILQMEATALGSGNFGEGRIELKYALPTGRVYANMFGEAVPELVVKNIVCDIPSSSYKVHNLITL